MEFKSYVATNIKSIRLMYNLTQKEFASRIGVSTSLVSKIENAVHIPNVEIIKSISDNFNVSADWIIGIELVMQDDPFVDLIYSFCQLSKNEQKLLQELVRVILSK